MTRELPHPGSAGLDPIDDPYDEFDDEPWADEEPPPTLTLTPTQRAVLGAAIAQGLPPRGGCDNRLTIAREFATAAGLEWKPLQEQLEGNGGYCDCEVLLNVLDSREYRLSGAGGDEDDDDVGEPD